jgi:hypothetical protein
MPPRLAHALIDTRREAGSRTVTSGSPPLAARAFFLGFGAKRVEIAAGRAKLSDRGQHRLMSDAAQEPNAQIGQLDSDQDEPLVLAAAAAIQRLIAERNALRSHAAAQEQELTRLRRHFTLIRNSNRRLTSEFVTQLQLLDSAAGTVVQEPRGPADSTHHNEKRDAPGD